MPTKYALPCPHCDQVIEVETRQAGQQISCPSCQKEAEAPRLGQLKRLQPIQSSTIDRPRERSGGGLFAAGLVLFVLAGVAGGLMAWYASNLIVDYNVVAAMDAWDKNDDEKMTSTFQRAAVFQSMNVDRGLGDWREQPHVAQTRQGNILLNFAYGLLGVSGMGLVLLLIGLFKR